VHPGVFAAKEPERPAVIMGTAGTGRDLRRAGGSPQPGGLAGQALRAAPRGDGLVAITGYCREYLAGFKCPRSLEFTTGELRTQVGKIRRGPLREKFGGAPGPYRPTYRT
jgi:acyl-CoA synthetase (AMP-forming)/AMP-acid ligase II